MSKQTFNLSKADRAVIFGLIPTVGDLATIKKSLKFMDEVKFTEKENEVDLSFNQVHDPKEREVARESWYKTEEEFHISDELVDLIRSEVRSRESAGAFDLNGPISVEFIEKFI